MEEEKKERMRVLADWALLAMRAALIVWDVIRR